MIFYEQVSYATEAVCAVAQNLGFRSLNIQFEKIDVGAKQEIHELIFALANQGIAIVAVSSELPELMHLSDRIMVMCEGKATGILSRAEASEERIMKLAALPSRRDATIKPVKA